jgi:hypothetical protein
MFGSLTSPVNSEKCFNSFATRFLLNELIVLKSFRLSFQLEKTILIILFELKAFNYISTCNKQ